MADYIIELRETSPLKSVRKTIKTFVLVLLLHMIGNLNIQNCH